MRIPTSLQEGLKSEKLLCALAQLIRARTLTEHKNSIQYPLRLKPNVHRTKAVNPRVADFLTRKHYRLYLAESNPLDSLSHKCIAELYLPKFQRTLLLFGNSY